MCSHKNILDSKMKLFHSVSEIQKMIFSTLLNYMLCSYKQLDYASTDIDLYKDNGKFIREDD